MAAIAQAPNWPSTLGRAAGAFYTINIATILIAVFLMRGLAGQGNAASSVGHFLSNESAVRLALALELISSAASIAVAALLYELLKPASASAALLMAFFRLAACAVAISGYAFQLSPLQIPQAAQHLGGFAPDQSAALAMIFHTFSGTFSRMTIVFFGFHFVLLGPLLIRSRLVPRVLGLLVGLAGLAGLSFLAPQIASHFFFYFGALGLAAEVSLALWLLIAGVNVQAWREQFTSATRRANALLLP